MLVTLARFSRLLKGRFSRGLLVKSKLSNRFLPGNILKTIENVDYSIRYCKILLHIYLGSSGLSDSKCVFQLTQSDQFAFIEPTVITIIQNKHSFTWCCDLFRYS